MTFLEFVLLYVLTHSFVIVGHIIFGYFEEEREQSLREMFESGQLSSEQTIRQQLDEMSQDCSQEQLESVDSSLYDLVDIDAVKAKLRAKNERLREIVLEVK